MKLNRKLATAAVAIAMLAGSIGLVGAQATTPIATDPKVASAYKSAINDKEWIYLAGEGEDVTTTSYSASNSYFPPRYASIDGNGELSYGYPVKVIGSVEHSFYNAQILNPWTNNVNNSLGSLVNYIVKPVESGLTYGTLPEALNTWLGGSANEYSLTDYRTRWVGKTIYIEDLVVAHGNPQTYKLLRAYIVISGGSILEITLETYALASGNNVNSGTLESAPVVLSNKFTSDKSKLTKFWASASDQFLKTRLSSSIRDVTKKLGDSFVKSIATAGSSGVTLRSTDSISGIGQTNPVNIVSYNPSTKKEVHATFVNGSTTPDFLAVFNGQASLGSLWMTIFDPDYHLYSGDVIWDAATKTYSTNARNAQMRWNFTVDSKGLIKRIWNLSQNWTIEYKAERTLTSSYSTMSANEIRFAAAALTKLNPTANIAASSVSKSNCTESLETFGLTSQQQARVLQTLGLKTKPSEVGVCAGR